MTDATATTTSTHTAPTVAPQKVGPYVLEQELGRGAHGVVYRAHHEERPQTPVALKVVENRGQPDKLLMEPQILSKLHHPGIVRLEDYFLSGQEMVVVMEFIQGVELKDYLEHHGAMTAGEVRQFLIQVASALEHAHAANVLHRDLKPANILVERKDGKLRFVLTDFGISRMSEGIQVTKHSGGTYQFMAPEQLRGRPVPQSDLWALGVVAYQMLTRQLPFVGKTVEELSHSVFFAIPSPPSQIAPDFDDDGLEQVLFGLLEKPANDRTASATELLNSLGVHSGTSVVSPVSTSVTANKTTYVKRAEGQIRGLWNRFWIVLVIQAAPHGFLPEIITYFGLFVFFRAQTTSAFWKRSLLEFGALALMTGAWISTFIGFALAPLWIGYGFIVGNLMAFVLFPLAISYVAKVRRLERELELRRAITESTTDSDLFLRRLRSYVDICPGDTNFHQKYVEALLACGRSKEAVVEAKLMIENDPYNVGANLLLAHAYFELGLYVQCVAVCDAYLAVTGYCFEFTELKADCARALTHVTHAPHRKGALAVAPTGGGAP